MSEPVSSPRAGLTWTVSALLLAVADTLAARFASVAVSGELSGFTRASSGHCYFTLKDADGAAAVVRCAMFRRAAALLDFQPADGQRVELRGRIAVYEARGELQMVVESLQRQGVGSLYEEFLRLRTRLAAQGLFDESRHRPINRHPKAVGVVTSLGAAALHDVLTALERRAPQVRVVVYPCLVQGVDAPRSIVEALTAAGARHEVDTVLLVRGGGSLEDLWSFNDERVVRAVAASPLPVICGVGHETDVTLCDLAADLRAPTPTAAAELAAPAAAELLSTLQQAARTLVRSARRALDRQGQSLDLLAQRAGRPAAALAAQRQHLDSLAMRLAGGVAHRAETSALHLQPLAQRLQRAGSVGLARRVDQLSALSARLAAAHPQQVLERGYAWVLGPDGRPAMHAHGLSPGAAIQAVFADGRVRATVNTVDLDPV